VAPAPGRTLNSKALPEPVADEHILLDDNKYIADVLSEFRNSKLNKEGFQSKLLFKKRMFRETDETITEPQFVNLSYVQAQHDYLQVSSSTAHQQCGWPLPACARSMSAAPCRRSPGGSPPILQLHPSPPLSREDSPGVSITEVVGVYRASVRVAHPLLCVLLCRATTRWCARTPRRCARCRCRRSTPPRCWRTRRRSCSALRSTSPSRCVRRQALQALLEARGADLAALEKYGLACCSLM
jgi:hypothetical protein